MRNRPGRPSDTSLPDCSAVVQAAPPAGVPLALLQVQLIRVQVLVARGEREAARVALEKARRLAREHARPVLAVVDKLEELVGSGD